METVELEDVKSAECTETEQRFDIFLICQHVLHKYTTHVKN